MDEYRSPETIPQAPRPHGAAPPSNLALAIFSTLCCCLPIGIVSIVFAAQSKGAAESGDYRRAAELGDKARGWALASIVLGMVAILISVATEVAKQ